MKCFLLIGAVLFLGLHSPCSYGEKPRLIVLAPGESAKVRPRGRGSLLLANGKVAKARELGAEIQIIGKTKGQTRLNTGDEIWSVVVTDRPQFATYKALEQALKGVMGLSLDANETEITLHGELLRWRDWQEIKDAVGANAQYRFSAKLSPALRQEARQRLSFYLQEAGLALPSLQFEPYARVTIAESAQGRREAYQKILRPYGIDLEVGPQMIDLEPMIRVKVVIAEVRKIDFLKYGVRWPEEATASLVQPDQNLMLNPNSDWVLHALEEKGLGKVLASPKLLCRSGKTAEFLAGGEFPIKIANYKTHDVIWKRHGVLLKIQPLVDLEGHMSMSLETEISLLDPSQTVEGIPALLTNRIQTHVDLKNAQTIALSGLLKQEWGQQQQGLPLLSRLPVLGALFSSRDYLERKTELVVFVTPEVVHETTASLAMPEELSHAQ